MKNTYLFDNLLSGAPYVEESDTRSKELMKSILEEIAHNRDGNELYKSFLERKGFNCDSEGNTFYDIPYLPVQIFKVLGSQLKTVPKEKIRTSISSSATSGVPSTVMIDNITARRQVKAMAAVMKCIIGNKRLPFLVMDLDPQGVDGSQLGARSAAVKGYINFSSKTTYCVENHKGRLVVNRNTVDKYLKSCEDEPTIIFGFTYVLFDALIKLFKDNNAGFKLPRGSKVVHIGGWKKLESEKIHKNEFNDRLASILGIEKNNIIDIYGFTEQMGLNYPDCSEGWKHIPRFVEVVVRDLKTHAPLDPGEKGALQFISPLPHSYPGNSILTDDIGVLDDSPCACGNPAKKFRILGRAPKAEIRGCGDVMGEKIKNTEKAHTLKAHDDNELITFINKYQNSSIKDISTDLFKHKSWLESQNVDMLIGLIDKVSRDWLNNPDLSVWKLSGLSFLVRWCSAENLRRLLSNGLRVNYQVLDSFTVVPDEPFHSWKAHSKGLVAHWLAGNVPLLGMLVLVQSILTKNLNVLKVSSNYSNALPDLLRTFSDAVYISPGGKEIHGSDLLKTVEVVYFPKSNVRQAHELSLSSNVRIAWGGREAIDAICELPSRAGTEDIIFGPKLSFMVIGKESLKNDRKLKKLFRKVATDISSFDQAACSSPHTIFIENGGDVSPEEFAEMLGGFMDKALITIPKEPEENAIINDIKTARIVGDFTGKVWSSQDYEWTIIYNNEPGLAKPCYSRVITICPVNHINETIGFITQDIQSIGLSAGNEKKADYAMLAAEKGVLRFPEIGRMTNFDSPWDGVFVPDRLVNWVSLGGPVF